MEDLWAFNDEGVARAIYRSKIPVISAVGHEPDVTIADFVADLRAATPSNGAELAVPNQADLRENLAHWRSRILLSMGRKLTAVRASVGRLRGSPFLKSPLRMIQEKRLLLDYQQQGLVHAFRQRLQAEQRRLGELAAALDAYSPLKVLGRGYSIAQREDGSVVLAIAQVKRGDGIQLRVSDGRIACTVTGKEPWNARKKAEF